MWFLQEFLRVKVLLERYHIIRLLGYLTKIMEFLNEIEVEKRNTICSIN